VAESNLNSYYERVGEHRYKPTRHTQGAWSLDDQHFSPLAGLIVHAVDRHRLNTRGNLILSRISFDILGRLAREECDIRVETIRPGRTIELVQATVVIADRPVVLARAWHLQVVDTRAVAGGFPDGLTPPGESPSWPMTSVWKSGYIASLDVRTPSPPQAGRATAWVSTGCDLVAGETSSPQASYIALVDTANGIGIRQPPTAWIFPNVDLTIHLYRQPEGQWTGLDTTVTFGRTGQGLTSTVLHDVNGPIGRAEQILTVRPFRT
jgi:Thioesterase-like superfamily